MTLEGKTIGFAITGSFCTFAQTLEAMAALAQTGANLIPILSPAAYETDTRFGEAADFRARIEAICGSKILCKITEVEPIGPRRLLDLLVILPCTGNTLAKLALGITDTPVVLAAKAHLRNQRPVLIGVSTNDALANSAKNIGMLANTKNCFLIPLRQDDPLRKPRSAVADFSQLLPAAEAALEGRQIQPIWL